jgi:hypothetical protein
MSGVVTAMKRLAAAALTVIAAAAALYFLCFVPFTCAMTVARITRATATASADVKTPAGRSTVEHNLRMIRFALDRCPRDIELLILAGVNESIMERHSHAIAMFNRALRSGPRAEIYFNLGLSQLAVGDRDAALDSFLIAAHARGAHLAEQIPDGILRTDVYRIIGHWENALLARAGGSALPDVVKNGKFSEPTESILSEHPAGTSWPAPVAAWTVFRGTARTVTATAVPSSRRPGGRAIHVTTDGSGSGLYQPLIVLDPPLSKAVTTAWVHVKSGQVFVRSGRVYSEGQVGILRPDAYSQTTGRWERIQGVSATCPVQQAVVFAATDGADFIIDEISVRPSPGPPCP